MSERYSPSLVAEGPLVFVSGQVPEAPDGSVAEGDAAEQARQAFRNIAAALAPHGADLRHVVKLTYYLRHIADLDGVRSALEEFLVHRPRPASTLVEVAGLVDTRYLLEIDAVATLPRA
ncbi:RidA family protein [Marinitenerispora sediminis]|uniref:Enamine deaminase RidA n=1 Tax=Marinitenerispora sediminis TaxID=1931232 RepID=A0A368T2Q2_9ACTN|nr:RidA family protein [Marinitenerispora sediminis]RCV48649.1 enamine deaminase RidA [Marinitenerispora sediminis]RCV50601.1 enamine deaminase RidA [Marinitenerispora sediminis]RCV56111.1 enamine deaminase RidA [Marinitenerispora sediminis]